MPWTKSRWPTSEEIRALRKEEDLRAAEHDDMADPICDCGQPGYACRCNELRLEEQDEESRAEGIPGGFDDPIE